MEYITDFHVHSRYAMACSKNITIRGMDDAAFNTGLQLIGTGDFTHPLWFSEIKEQLKEYSKGIYQLKGENRGTKFMLTCEIGTTFDEDNKSRRIHNVVVAPNMEAVEQINAELAKLTNLSADGRPQLNISASDLVERLFEIDKNMFVFPAHIWTPWFAALGEFSGYSSIKEAYQDQEKNIRAVETGLSSDPDMNWRVSSLDKYALLSNSDAHSLPKMGREANVFDIRGELTLNEVLNAVKDNDSKKLKMTIEFYPEAGKYHYDGHRNCNVCLHPKDALKFNNRCPVCGRKITVGVLHRVEELADRDEGYVRNNAVPFVHCVPLLDVIAYMKEKTPISKPVRALYEQIVAKFGSEYNVLLKADYEAIAAIDEDTAIAIDRVRKGKVNLIPSYDGVFGTVDIMNRIKKKDNGRQAQLI